MSQRAGAVYQFGPFRYDSAQRVLFRDGELVPLVPKAIEVLQALLERRGRVVEKAELMKLVWPDCVVEEVGLARNISLLRKALGDDGEAYIETISKRGYRFSVTASAAGDTRPARVSVRRRLRMWAAVAAACLALAAFIYLQFYRPSRFVPAPGRAATLAVVPFECLSASSEGDALCKGLTENVVDELSKLNSVQIISPSTVQRYRRLRIPTAIMARLLRLEVVVEGSAQRSGEKVRLSVRLADVHSGRLIWAEGYEFSAGNLDAQSGISRSVAQEIGRRLAA